MGFYMVVLLIVLFYQIDGYKPCQHSCGIGDNIKEIGMPIGRIIRLQKFHANSVAQCNDC